MGVKDFVGKHKGETCFVLGNGPSLRDVDLASLPYPTFGSNRIYLSGFEPTYYSCVNPLVLEQFKDEIAQMKSIKFLNEPYASEMDGVAIDTSLDYPAYKVAWDQMWEGHTVTYVLLQLATTMGFRKIILLGVDHDYGDKSADPNIELTAVGPDPYHFSPDYFSQGTVWNAPDLGRSELAYSLAKNAAEFAKVEIINASSRTKLRVFPLESLNRVLHPDPPRVSAIVSAYKCPVDWLHETIDDIDVQDEEAEIVVVCQEGSEHHRLTQDFKHLKVVTTKDIPTVYKAWNLGVRAASGKYLTNCNTDDRRQAMSMQLMADVLDARPEIDVVYHDQYITWDHPCNFDLFLNEIEEAGVPLVSGRFEGKRGAFLWSDHNLKLLSQGCYIGPQPMWRASLHQLHGGFLESYKSAGDYEFWLRVAKEDNFFHIPAFLGVYCARMEGIEMSSPTIGANESLRAIMMNQDPDGLEYTPSGSYVKAEIGGKYSFVPAGALFEVIERLKGNYAVDK